MINTKEIRKILKVLLRKSKGLNRIERIKEEVKDVKKSAADFKEQVIDVVEEPIGNQNAISNMILSNNINEKVLFQLFTK